MSDSELKQLLSRVSRRQVLKTGLAAGMTWSVVDLVAACGGSTAGTTTSAGGTDAGKTVTLVYAAQQDDSGTIQKQVDAWNSANAKTQVKYQQMPKVSGDYHTQLVASFTSKATVPDVFDADVIWPGEFAAAGWLKPIDGYLTDSFKKGLFESAVTVGKYKDKTYAIQRYYDAGRLYYRTDLLQKYSVSVPKTMDELVAGSKKIQDGERAAGNPNFWGFYWIGAQIEALFDEFLEWYWAFGGELTDKSGKIAFNNDAGLKSVNFMHDTIYSNKISPPGTPTYKTPDIVPFMQNGNTAFMRNWGFAYKLLQDEKQSKVVGKVSIAPLPGSTKLGFGCTGGWTMAINAQSAAPDRAFEFMTYMLGTKGQTTMATGAGLSPVRPDVLNDAAVQSSSPDFKQLPEILKNTKARPQIKNYTQVSGAIQPQLSAIMTNQKSPAEGLKAAQAAVDALLNA